MKPLAFALCSLVACAAPQTPTSPAPMPPAPPLAASAAGDTATGPLELRASAVILDTQRALRNGMVLRSGDVLRLVVEVTQPAWLYLAYIDARGEAVLLFPTTERAERVAPGERVRVPRGYDLRVDRNVGEEHLVLVASTRALDESDPELHQLFARIRPPPAPSMPVATAAPVETPTSPRRHHDRPREQPRADVAAAPAPAVSPPPERAGTTLLLRRPRGIELVASHDDTPIVVRADEGGVVMWRVSFQHVDNQQQGASVR